MVAQRTGRRVIVVGAGAAGLLAAGHAAEEGAEVILLEKMRRSGRKLGLTGKGRCNLTNSAPLDEFIAAFGPNGRFLRQAFMAFFNADLVALIRELGVEVDLERGGRYFPVDNKATDIARALYNWAVAAGVDVHLNGPASALIQNGNRVVGVKAGRLRKHEADAVIIATGGLSYPETGSSGDGYRLAESVGHTVVPTRPGLVPVETSGDIARRLQGLTLRNVTARLIIDGKKQDEMLGELLFTHFGLSGPVVLQMSRQMIDALNQKKEVHISLDLKPGLDEKLLEARLLRDLKDQGKRHFRTILKGLLPASLIPVCADLVDIPPEALGNQITTAERRRLREWLKNFSLKVTGHRSYDEAIVTVGGINLKEVDPRTMASRLVEGLYFAGEVLDLDGPTGGYNLQAAFSTGWLAGQSAALGPST